MTILLSLFVFLFTSCESNDAIETQAAPAEYYEYVETVEAISQDCIDSVLTITSADSLTQFDVDGLLLMREEEKLARDVYAYFYEQYELKIFSNITASEERHAAAVLYLLESFGIEDPMQEEVGVFANETLQELYTSLTAAGTTIEEALATGAYIEEYDIVDLEELIEATEIAAIERVYGNLLAGSGNHLRGFVRTLGNYGVSYEPQILSVEKFDELIADSNSCGQGNRQGQGKQQNSMNGQNGNGSRGENGNGQGYRGGK